MHCDSINVTTVKDYGNEKINRSKKKEIEAMQKEIEARKSTTLIFARKEIAFSPFRIIKFFYVTAHFQQQCVNHGV